MCQPPHTPHLGSDAAFDRKSRETSQALGLFPDIWLTTTVYLSQVHTTIHTPSPHTHTHTHTHHHRHTDSHNTTNTNTQTHTDVIDILLMCVAGSYSFVGSVDAGPNSAWRHHLVSEMAAYVRDSAARTYTHK